jgi:hypothetical protein
MLLEGFGDPLGTLPLLFGQISKNLVGNLMERDRCKV